MHKHIGRFTFLTLAAGAVMGQQNIPCPDYGTVASRVQSAREVRLCLDDHENPQKPLSAKRIRRRIPDPARHELELGVTAAQNRLNEEALQHFVEAVRIDPYYWDAVAHLGSALVRLREPSQALEFLMRAMMIEPRQVSTHVDMAWAMLFLGKPDMAEGYARHALEVAPESEPANYVLAWALILQSRHSDDLVRALSIAKRRLPDASNLMVLPVADERR